MIVTGSIKLKQKRYKAWMILLRLIKTTCGAVGVSTIIADFKWTGLAISTLAVVANEAMAIIKEEETEIVSEEVPENNPNPNPNEQH